MEPTTVAAVGAPELKNGKEIDQSLLDEMVKAGVLYGRKKSKTHPRMHSSVYAIRNGIGLLDVGKTVRLIDEAAASLKDILAKKGLVLFVGTTPAARASVKAIADRFSCPFVVERWLGGTLTNFKTLSQRIQHLIRLRADRDAGRLAKYTKKERLEFDRDIEHMTVYFGGLEKLSQLPQALLVVGATAHDIAIREARRIGIPLFAVMSNDADPDQIDHPILANDRSKSSIEWVLQRLEKAIGDPTAAHSA